MEITKCFFISLSKPACGNPNSLVCNGQMPILTNRAFMCKRSIRAIPIGKQTKEHLLAHQQHVKDLRDLKGDQWKENNLIFPTQVGTPLTQGNMNKKFKQILADCNLKNIRFHDLRHTAASIMINAGIPIIQVSHMLGHSSVSITLDTYSHLIPSMHTTTADQIDKLLALDED